MIGGACMVTEMLIFVHAHCLSIALALVVEFPALYDMHELGYIILFYACATLHPLPRANNVFFFLLAKQPIFLMYPDR